MSAQQPRGAEQVSLRLPPGLRDRIKAHAERNGRSMNTEIVVCLESAFSDGTGLPPELASAIERHIQTEVDRRIAAMSARGDEGNGDI